MNIEIPFKEVFTSNTVNYQVQARWTINEMVEYLTPKIVTDFNIREEDIELVPNNQSEDCTPCELMSSLNELNYGNKTLEEEYGSNLLVGFYVRRKNNSNNIQNSLINECVVCLNNRITTNSFGCLHQLCRYCSTRCRNIGHNRCPICRQNLIGEAM
jgi:hypothetical protein